MRIEELIAKTSLRIRLLRAVRWSSRTLLVALAACVAALLLQHFGALPALPAGALIGLALGAAGAAALLGALLRVNVARALYELDQRLATGEVLLTLSDLKRRQPQGAFTSILERAYARLNVQPGTVFRITPRDWGWGGGAAVLAALTLALLWWGPLLPPLLGLPAAPAASAGRGQSPDGLALEDLPEALRGKLDDLLETIERLGLSPSEDQTGLPPDDSDPQSLIELYDQLARAQDQALGLSHGARGSAPDRTQERQVQREQLERLRDQLDEMLDSLEAGGDGEGQDALRQGLEQLPPDDSVRREVEQAIEQRDPGALRDALERARERLDDRLGAEAGLDELRQALEDWTGDPQSGEAAEGEQQPGPAQPGAGGSERPEADPAALPEDAGPAGQPGGDEQPGDGSGQTVQDRAAGEEAGSGPAAGGPAAGAPDWDPSYKNAKIPPGLVPAESLEEWLSRGVPIETEAVSDGSAQFRLSYDQVEALLDVRDLSPELRDVVRLYFLKIIGQLNDAEGAGP